MYVQHSGDFALTAAANFTGAMKNVKIDYVPRWAMYLEETRWLNEIKDKAAKVGVTDSCTCFCITCVSHLKWSTTIRCFLVMHHSSIIIFYAMLCTHVVMR